MGDELDVHSQASIAAELHVNEHEHKTEPVLPDYDLFSVSGRSF
jgi:hypothetical protein